MGKLKLSEKELLMGKYLGETRGTMVLPVKAIEEPTGNK
jgi:hypothetical protein